MWDWIRENLLLLFYQFIVLDFHIAQIFQRIARAAILEPSTKDVLLSDFLALVSKPCAVFAVGRKFL